jgi:hypothetical protein
MPVKGQAINWRLWTLAFGKSYRLHQNYPPLQRRNTPLG